MSHPDQTPHPDNAGTPEGTSPQAGSPYANTSYPNAQYPAGTSANASYPTSQYADPQYTTPQYTSPQYTGAQPVGQPAQRSGGISGFLRALFDTSFTRFVTPSLVRILYILSMIGIGLYWIGSVIVLFATSRETTYYGEHRTNGAAMTMAVLDLLFGWILALISLAFVRMQFEFVMALIRTSEYARDIKAHLTGSERPNL